VAEDILYVFDFDDTLAWASDWYEDIPLDGRGYVTGPGKSPSMAAGLSFIQKAKTKDVPLELKDLHLRIESDLRLEKYRLLFLLVDSLGNPVSREQLEPYFSEEELSVFNLGSTSPFPPGYLGIMYDDPYYYQPNTIGDGGVNQEMMDLYRQHRENAVILTARDDLPELRQAIEDFLVREGGGLPMKMILKQPGESGGPYKGRAILEMTKWPYDKIHFFDDNPGYIKAVYDVIDQHDREFGTNLAAKVQITMVNQMNKPAYLLKNRIIKLIKLADNYDNQRLSERADRIDKELKKLAEVFKDG
jgi:hypothetical protein